MPARSERPRRQRGWWRPLLLGTPSYWVAFIITWSVATTVLLILCAIVVSRPVWLHPILGLAAMAEAGFGLFLINVLRRGPGRRA